MKMRYLLFLCFSILISVCADAQANLSRGLVAYYPFNGNANDESGNSLNGIARNGAQLTTDKYGQANSAYLFDGIDDYIEILDDPRLRFRDSFSICISFMKSAQDGGNLIEKRDFFNGTNSSFDLAAGAAGANGAIKSNNNCSDAIAFDYTSHAPVPNLNQWYCIVLTFKNGTMKFYQDGVLISSTSTTGASMDGCAGSNIRIGYHLNFDPIAMNGKIDEVRLYDRDINIDEINAYCNASAPGCNPTNPNIDYNRGLVAYYPFNGNANDESGNSLNGIPRNGVQLTTDKIGNANSAYLFDGVNDYIEVIDNSKLRFRDSFSICLSYMKLDNDGGNLIEKRNISNGAGSSFDIAAGSSGANGAVKTFEDCNDAVNGWNYTALTQPQSIDRWYCLVMTYKQGVLKLYEDGALISSTTTALSRMDSCLGNIRIGYHLNFDPLAFHGKIDEVRLYNRNLNLDEIRGYCDIQTTCCNTGWLNTPAKLTGVTVGQVNVTGNQLTVEAMCNAQDIYDLSRALVSKHEYPGDVNYFLCPDLAQITTDNGFFSATSPCSFVSNKTYHVAMVYDGSSLKLYRNGFLMKEVPASGNLVNNSWPTTIGEYAYSLFTNNPAISNIFKGYINEVRIWNVARTQQQIKDYMNTSLPNPSTQTGLLAYYIFDDLNNKQGNSLYNGTLNGGATINNGNPECSFVADSCAATPVSCTQWLKTPDKLTGVSIGELDITGNQMTIEAMCNASDIYDLSRALVSKHGWQANCNYFLCPDLAQITTTDGFFSATSPCSFVSNKTYHVAMVYNGSSLRLYRNGFLMQEVPATGNLITNNWPAIIGEYAYAMFFNDAGISNIFKGYINEVRIWNVARTQQQINDYMNTSLPNPASQQGLLGYYTFDGLNNKQGNTLYDGTLRGAATINNTNPECSFVADSCTATTPCSSNWLNIPNSNSYATCGEIDITGNQLTIEGWCARDSALTPEGYTSLNVVSKHFTPADVNYLLRIDRAQVTTTQGHFVTPEICLTENKKAYHVAMVYDGSNLKFYRNGFLMSQIACTGNLIQNNWLTTIGATAGNPTTNTTLIGYINEVRIWNVARTQQQIKDYLGGSLPNPTTQPGLLAYYSYGDLTNRQGNSLYNGVLHGNAVINATNPNCTLSVDTCLTVVPVTFTGFTVFATAQKNIQLNWHTEQENGILNYIVERSTLPAGPFEAIGTVNSKNGNSNGYLFIDNTALTNIKYYYRLRINDNNGTRKFSAIKDALIKTTNGLFVHIYPNPAKNVFTVQLANTNEAAVIKLYNNVGQLVLEKKTAAASNAYISINVNHLPKGSYNLQVITSKEKVAKQIQKL